MVVLYSRNGIPHVEARFGRVALEFCASLAVEGL